MGRRAASAVVAIALAFIRCGEAAPATLAHPPPEPDAPCAPSTGNDVRTFAIDSLDFGERTANGWESLGYDLDGKLTTASSRDVCAQAAGAPDDNQRDGEKGIDNAFGHLVVPMLESALGGVALSDPLTAAIRAGRFTLQIQTAGVVRDPAETCDGAQAQVFASDVYDTSGAAPTFDETTDWPVLGDSLRNPLDIASGANAVFYAYVTHGTFVAGVGAHVTVPFYVAIGNVSIALPVHEAILTFDHVDDADAANGILTGVLDPLELVRALEAAAIESGQPVYCGDGYNGWWLETTDILGDRSNVPGVPCDHISFAVGFHAHVVHNPTKIAAPLPPPPKACGLDAGTD